jgi:hypothetical protein
MAPHQVVVKSLQASELDRDIASVFAEARALEDVDHPGIIRLRHCDFAGAGASAGEAGIVLFFANACVVNYVQVQS